MKKLSSLFLTGLLGVVFVSGQASASGFTTTAITNQVGAAATRAATTALGTSQTQLAGAAVRAVRTGNTDQLRQVGARPATGAVTNAATGALGSAGVSAGTAGAVAGLAAVAFSGNLNTTQLRTTAVNTARTAAVGAAAGLVNDTLGGTVINRNGVLNTGAATRAVTGALGSAGVSAGVAGTVVGLGAAAFSGNLNTTQLRTTAVNGLRTAAVGAVAGAVNGTLGGTFINGNGGVNTGAVRNVLGQAVQGQITGARAAVGDYITGARTSIISGVGGMMTVGGDGGATLGGLDIATVADWYTGGTGGMMTTGGDSGATLGGIAGNFNMDTINGLDFGGVTDNFDTSSINGLDLDSVGSVGGTIANIDPAIMQQFTDTGLGDVVNGFTSSGTLGSLGSTIFGGGSGATALGGSSVQWRSL